MQGLTDEIHSVVKQSLSSFEKILSILLDHHADWFYPKVNPMQQHNSAQSLELSLDFLDIKCPLQLLHAIFDRILLVFDNKYWVVQNKYCRFVAVINYDSLCDIIGRDQSDVYKVSSFFHTIFPTKSN